MTVREVQDEILRLKKEKNITILAHSYEAQEILEIADFTGDSFALSKKAAEDDKPTCVMCGVHFMAETVKILSPAKKVILAHPHAGCPMAEQFTPDFVENFRRDNPDYAVVAYINTTAALKEVCDVCVTSASAVKICAAIPNKNILFIPDCNLGAYVAKMLPEKNIKLVDGGCPVHSSVAAAEAEEAKRLHPNAELLTHPECVPAVLEKSDFVGSTAAIIRYATESTKKEFIIGTEISIAEYLSYTCPDKTFYRLSKKLICHDMKLTSLVDVLNALNGTGGLEIEMTPETIKRASVCINEMLRLG